MEIAKKPSELAESFGLAERLELTISFEKRTFYAENQTPIYNNYITKLPSII